MMRKLVGWSFLLTMAVVGGLASPMAGQVAAQCSDAEKAHQFWVRRFDSEDSRKAQPTGSIPSSLYQAPIATSK